jgi:hypothetical protein
MNRLSLEQLTISYQTPFELVSIASGIGCPPGAVSPAAGTRKKSGDARLCGAASRCVTEGEDCFWVCGADVWLVPRIGEVAYRNAMIENRPIKPVSEIC